MAMDKTVIYVSCAEVVFSSAGKILVLAKKAGQSSVTLVAHLFFLS